MRVEAQYASQILDLDLPDIDAMASERHRLLALADTLRKLPASRGDARLFLTMAVLASAQHQHQLWDDPAERDRKRLLVADPPMVVCLRPDNRIVFREVPSGRVVRELPLAQSHWVEGMTLDGSGKHLSVYAWTGSGHVTTIWSVATGGKSCERPSDQVPVLSPDGRYVITRHTTPPNRLFQSTTDDEPMLVRVADARTGATRWQTAVYSYRWLMAGDPKAHLAFTPDGRAVVISGSTSEASINVHAIDDGRVLLSPPGYVWSLTPSGRHLAVVYDGVESGEPGVTWYRTTDWAVSGRSAPPAATDAWVEFRAFERWAFHDGNIAGRTGSLPCAQTEGSESVLSFDDHRLLTSAGRVIEFDPPRVHPRPGDRRYSREARKLAPDDRFLKMRTSAVAPELLPEPMMGLKFFEVLDLEMERILPLPSKGFQGPHRAGGTLALTTRGERTQWTDDAKLARQHLVLLPSRELPIPDEVLRLWAQVVACGERTADGRFVEWDEPAWEARRQELARRAAPVDGFPFPGSVASDRLHWARRCVGADEKGERPDHLALLDRLVSAEPGASTYTARAGHHFRERNYAAAIDDWERLDRVVGCGIKLPLDELLQRNPALTPQQWARLERLLGHERGYWDSRAFVLYRSGRYQELVDRAARDRLGHLSGLGIALSLPAAPLMILNSFLPHETESGYTARNDDEGYTLTIRIAGEDPAPYLLAMSLYRLGRVADARAVWDSLPAPSQLGRVLGRVDDEAAKLTGWPLPAPKTPQAPRPSLPVAPPPREVHR